MIVFPCAKINLGLNIVRRRDDGYHDIETVMYPIPVFDALEAKLMDERFPCPGSCDIKVSGNALDCNENDNLVVRAYNMIAHDYKLPRVHIHLFKNIPSQAGLGGGSSDASYMIRLLDERFRLNMGIAKMEDYAARLGADCAFFITAETAFASGIGSALSPISNDDWSLEGLYLALVKPDVAVSTKEAYARVKPQQPLKCCRDIVRQPIETWKNELTNDFEPSVFAIHPILGDVKKALYDAGAVYAQMSGSGSTVFGLFREQPDAEAFARFGGYTNVVKL